MATAEQRFPTARIPEENRREITITDYSTKEDDAYRQVARTLSIAPDKQKEFDGYWGLRGQEVLGMLAVANTVKELAVLTELTSFQQDSLLQNTRKLEAAQRQILKYEDKLLQLIEKESDEDFQKLLEVQVDLLPKVIRQAKLKIVRLQLEGRTDADQTAADMSTTRLDPAPSRTFDYTLDDNNRSLAEAMTAAQRTKVSKDDLARIVWDGRVATYTKYKLATYELFGKYSTITWFNKMRYMEATLPKSLKSKVLPYPDTEEGYRDLWAMLSRNYGREQDLIRSHEEDLQKLPYVSRWHNQTDLYNDQVFVEHVSKLQVALKELSKLGKSGKDNHSQYVMWVTARVDPSLALPFLKLYNSKSTWDTAMTNDPLAKWTSHLIECQQTNHDLILNRKGQNPSLLQEAKNEQHSNGKGKGRGNGKNGKNGQNGNGNHQQLQTYATQSAEVVSKPLDKCLFCGKKDHPSYRCTQQGDLDQAFAKVYKADCCTGCLRQGHRGDRCPTRRKCGLNNCSKYHNRKLHLAKYVPFKVWVKTQPKQQSNKSDKKKGDKSAAKDGDGQGRPPDQ